LRVQGGTSGILAALFAGRLDPFDAAWERDHFLGLSEQESDRRARRRRVLRRHKHSTRFQRLYDADMA
jgi:hypothetical protein